MCGMYQKLSRATLDMCLMAIPLAEFKVQNSSCLLGEMMQLNRRQIPQLDRAVGQLIEVANTLGVSTQI